MEATTWWTGLLETAVVPDAAHRTLVASVRVTDTDLPAHGADLPLSVVVGGGAGQLAGPAALCTRRGWPLAALRVTLRDPGDLRGNARRVVAAVDDARAQGALPEEVAVQVVLPAAAPTPDWVAAVEEVAARELVVALPTEDAPAPLLRAWLDVVLDRETPVVALGGDPVALLAETRRALDGEPAAADGADPLAGLDDGALRGARRWLLGVAVDDAAGLDADLRARGLLP